jgi:glycosyltransferase involved in cell wall biosynthesis
MPHLTGSLAEKRLPERDVASEAAEAAEAVETVDTSRLTPYPVAMPIALKLPLRLDDAGIPFRAATTKDSSAYHPAAVARYALAQWNAYLANGRVKHRQAFMAQVSWLCEHEVCLNTGASVWPMPLYARSNHARTATISALTQGNVISVLTRAYRLTGAETFLHTARRAVRPFLLDILDGGVSAPIGDDGIFFEEAAMYPAAHVLAAHLFAILGLHDYVAATNDREIAAIIERGHTTLHRFLTEFDAKFWSRGDLLKRNLASPASHALHAALLKALARHLPCEQCEAQAKLWAAWQHRFTARLRYFLSTRNARIRGAAGKTMRRIIFGKQGVDRPTARDLVCVPITAFPVAGGMRSVLAGVAHAMADEWEIEYLTQEIGPHSGELTIHGFGNTSAVPWRFPNVWLYAYAGLYKLIQLLRQGHRYRLIIPQDGAFSGAFASVVARMAGVRVLCMDHGNVTLPYSPVYAAERKRRRMATPMPRRLLLNLRDACYFPSLRLLVRIAIRYTDAFLPAGDDVADAYLYHYGISPSRMLRYPFMIDAERFTPLTGTAREELRAQQGIARDAILITMVNRLAPEKGIDVAIEGLSQALSALPADRRSRVHMIIAGEGQLRGQIETAIRDHKLEATCRLWGEATRADVAMLLGISDVFLHTGTRGINPVALLEAMAAGCGVISTTAPQVVARYLDENRGIAVPIGDLEAIASALTRTITDLPYCRQMGLLAREYIATHFTATALRRSLLRAAFWAPNIAELIDTNPV